MLAQRGMIGSMSAKGNCYDNAAMERFFGTLKDEKIRSESLRSLQEAKETIANWIAMEYNTKRPHSSLGYISPCAFEEKLSRMNLVD
ncbi:MAG: integrase core domain-containing protein [Gammaproteobacteria bacterium]|nr:integrase core domain-containing protein [Gammaproteobacteria bacterium]